MTQVAFLTSPYIHLSTLYHDSLFFLGKDMNLFLWEFFSDKGMSLSITKVVLRWLLQIYFSKKNLRSVYEHK